MAHLLLLVALKIMEQFLSMLLLASSPALLWLASGPLSFYNDLMTRSIPNDDSESTRTIYDL